jgi:hypothetical protein
MVNGTNNLFLSEAEDHADCALQVILSKP